MRLTSIAASALGRVFITTGASFFIQFVTLGSGIALARGLEPTGRGELAIAMQWPLILAGLAGLGVPDAVAYHSAHRDGARSPMLSSALTLGVLQSVVAMVVGFFLLPILLSGSSTIVVQGALIYLLIIPLHPVSLYPLGMLQGARDLRAFNLARSGPHVGYTFMLFILWAIGLLTVDTALLASITATAANAIFCLWLVVRLKNVLMWSVDLRQIVALLRFGWKVYVGQVAGLIAGRADIIALSSFASATAVGLYVAANTVGAAAAVVPSSLGLVLFPAFARLKPERITAAVARLVWMGLAFLCGAIVLIATVLPPLMVLLLGDSFRPAEGVARIAGTAAAVRACGVVLASVLRGLGKPL